MVALSAFGGVGGKGPREPSSDRWGMADRSGIADQPGMADQPGIADLPGIADQPGIAHQPVIADSPVHNSLRFPSIHTPSFWESGVI